MAKIAAGSDLSTGGTAPPLRLVLSESVVVGVNPGDAKAAIAVWSEELLKTIDVKMSFAPGQEFVMPSDQLLVAVRRGKVDLVGLSVQEYRQVAPYLDATRILTEESGGEEYLLVVREGSGIVNLAGLRGRSLIFWESPNTGLAEPWLTVSLWREGLESPRQCAGRLTKTPKLAQAVLPVFFGRADACVVTRRGLDTMAELNPQLTQKLRVIRTSPKMEGTVFACRKDYPPDLKKTILDGLVGLRSSPPAKQMLIMFQSSGFASGDNSSLRSAITLLDAWERHGSLDNGGAR